jgi:hypothetical protein
MPPPSSSPGLPGHRARSVRRPPARKVDSPWNCGQQRVQRRQAGGDKQGQLGAGPHGFEQRARGRKIRLKPVAGSGAGCRTAGAEWRRPRRSGPGPPVLRRAARPAGRASGCAPTATSSQRATARWRRSPHPAGRPAAGRPGTVAAAPAPCRCPARRSTGRRWQIRRRRWRRGARRLARSRASAAKGVASSLRSCLVGHPRMPPERTRSTGLVECPWWPAHGRLPKPVEPRRAPQGAHRDLGGCRDQHVQLRQIARDDPQHELPTAATGDGRRGANA